MRYRTTPTSSARIRKYGVDRAGPDETDLPFTWAFHRIDEIDADCPCDHEILAYFEESSQPYRLCRFSLYTHGDHNRDWLSPEIGSRSMEYMVGFYNGVDQVFAIDLEATWDDTVIRAHQGELGFVQWRLTADELWQNAGLTRPDAFSPFGYYTFLCPRRGGGIYLILRAGRFATTRHIMAIDGDGSIIKRTSKPNDALSANVSGPNTYYYTHPTGLIINYDDWTFWHYEEGVLSIAQTGKLDLSDDTNFMGRDVDGLVYLHNKRYGVGTNPWTEFATDGWPLSSNLTAVLAMAPTMDPSPETKAGGVPFVMLAAGNSPAVTPDPQLYSNDAAHLWDLTGFPMPNNRTSRPFLNYIGSDFIIHSVRYDERGVEKARWNSPPNGYRYISTSQPDAILRF